jgi:transcriptional regulator with XRE-family HTH domain
MATARQALRQRRERQGLTQESAAFELRIAVSTYRSWERGEKTPRVGHRPKLARLLDVTLAEVDIYLDGQQVAAPNGQQVPQWLTLHASLEQGASHIWAFHAFTVHALLQTADYAAAVERADAIPKSDDGIARRVEMRLARQGVIQREPDPVELSVILDESVLHRVTGGREVMADQLTHLATMAELPNIDVRILPLDAGQHSAAFGAFTMIATPGATEPQIVCVEDRTGVRYLEGSHGVDAHQQVFEHLGRYALPPGESVDVIRSAGKERYQP